MVGCSWPKQKAPQGARAGALDIPEQLPRPTLSVSWWGARELCWPRVRGVLGVPQLLEQTMSPDLGEPDCRRPWVRDGLRPSSD